MARPKLPEHEKKTINKTFRCSPEESDSITFFCQKENITLLELVTIGMGKQPPPKKNIADLKFKMQLGKLANNLNQISRSLNSGNKAARLMAIARISEIEELKILLKGYQEKLV